MKNRLSEKEAFAEAAGVVVCVTVVLLYMAGTGRYIINGVGFFILMPFSFAAYLIMTAIQLLPSASRKTRRILFAAKLVIVIAALMLSPLLCNLAARLINI